MMDGGLPPGVKEGYRGCSSFRHGVCCTLCGLGPCRVEEGGKGRCGASPLSISLTALMRGVTHGASAHANLAMELLDSFEGSRGRRGRAEAERVLSALRPPEVKGSPLRRVRNLFRSALYNDPEPLLSCVPAVRKGLWREGGAYPASPLLREVVTPSGNTVMGCEQSPEMILRSILRLSICDGYGLSRIASNLTDILLSHPAPVYVKVNPSVLRERAVNIVVHGHNPLFVRSILEAARSREGVLMAEEAGAEEGMNVAGLCCTGLDNLARYAVPLIGNFLNQELVVLTGAVDALVLDNQCILPMILDVADPFQTRIFSTSPLARFRGGVVGGGKGVTSIDSRGSPISSAMEVVKGAVSAFRERGRVSIPGECAWAVAGFTPEVLAGIMGGQFRPTLKPLNRLIIMGDLPGIAVVAGCDSPLNRDGRATFRLIRRLIENNILVLVTGCETYPAAGWFLLDFDAQKVAGPHLKEFCRTYRVPPVLSFGSCVDNWRILHLLHSMLLEGGLGEDISHIPVVAAVPFRVSEKALAYAFLFPASGIPTWTGEEVPVPNIPEVRKFLEGAGVPGYAGLKVRRRVDLMAGEMIEAIHRVRRERGYGSHREEELFNMKRRRITRWIRQALRTFS